MAAGEIAQKEMTDYLRSVPTGYITDAFIRLGLRGWISGLQSSQPPGSVHLAAPAATVQYAPVRGKRSSNLSLYEIFRQLAPGQAVVIAGAGAAGWVLGDNVCTAAKVEGMAGIVLDGCLRDIQDIRELDFPLFYRQAAASRQEDMEIVAFNVPVTCVGARVHPEDVVVMDRDGGLVIPPGYLAQVVENVREIAILEQEQDNLIRQRGPLDKLRQILMRKKAPIEP